MQKETLLLIPGTASDKRVWAHQIQHLSDIVDIVVADLRDMNTIPQLVEKAIENLPNQFLVAGHSLGGWLIFEILKRYPNRIKKACFLSTTAGLDSEKLSHKRQERIEQAKQNNFTPIAHDLTELFTYREETKPKVFEIFNQNRALFITQQEAILTKTCNIDLLAKIKQPSLVIVGRHDKVFFESSVLISQKIPHADLAIIEDCGHMLTLERPQATTALMRLWLTQGVTRQN